MTIPTGAINCCTSCSGEFAFETVDSAPRVAMVLSGDVTANTVESVAHGYVADDEVRFYATAGETLPAGLTPGVTYFVLATGLTADAFKVSLTSAGSPVDITGEGAALVRLATPGSGTFTMHRQAWCLTDLSSLWEVPNQRGANVIIPGIEGRYAEPRRTDETDYALPFIISGVVTEAAALASNENNQLRANMLYLRSNVLDPPTPPLATRPASLLSPDGMTMLTADVQFGDSPLVRSRKESGLWFGTLHLVIPAGAFA